MIKLRKKLQEVLEDYMRNEVKTKEYDEVAADVLENLCFALASCSVSILTTSGPGKENRADEKVFFENILGVIRNMMNDMINEVDRFYLTKN